MIKRYLSLLIILFLLLSGLVPLNKEQVVEAQERLDPTIISDLTIPGVVFIVTIIEAILRIPTTDDQGNPTNEYIEVQVTDGGVGSGFFVNNDGYIVTNGHVVMAFTHTDYTEDIIVKRRLAELAAMEIVNRQREPVPPDAVQALIQYIERNGEIKDAIRVVLVIVGESTGGKIRQDGIQARVVGNPEPFFGRDLAVIKIEATNTPSLPLSEVEEIQPGQTVFAFGYPGVVNFHELLSEDTRLFPSMTSGIVGGLRKTAFDVPAVQMDADIVKGNSGGPVLNDRGEVIGVANMGSLGEDLQPVAGFNFFIPLSVLKQYLNELNVQYNTRGPVDQLWYEGVGLYYAGLYSRAKQVFEQVRTLYPFNWYATTMIQRAQGKISEGIKVDATLEISANATQVSQGEAVEITGTLSFNGDNPLGIDISFKDVLIDVNIQVGGEVDTRSVRVGDDNTFRFIYEPTSSGEVVITAKWIGDEDFNPVEQSLTIVVAAPELPIWMFAIPVLAIAAIGIYYVYNKGVLRQRGRTLGGFGARPRQEVRVGGDVVYCPNCGSANKPTAKFCVQCGMRLEGG